MKVVISIPAYNEKNSIGKVIHEIKGIMKSLKYKYEVFVVDDGSTDDTANIAKKAGATVHSHPINYGLAETFKTEIDKCLELKADIIVHTDADGQYMAKDIPNLLKEIEKGNDLVLGSRFRGHIESMPLIKRIGNQAFSKVISNITRLKITDSQTGFRAFTKEIAKNINIISTFTYTQEQIIKAAKQKYRIKEIPIDTNKTRKSKLMKSPLDFAIKAWINILRVYRDYEPLKFFGIFGSIFLFSGILVGIWLLYLFFTTGSVGHVPSTILSVMLILLGVQIISFGFLADMQKTKRNL
jgi:glycosyltransferase involved in cell wall biosynthesis